MQFFGVAYQECRAIKKSHNHFMLSSQLKHFDKMQPFFSLQYAPNPMKKTNAPTQPIFQLSGN